MAKKQERYEITEEDIHWTIIHLKNTDPQNATREGAIRYLESMQATSHLAAHKIVEDMKSGKLKMNQEKKN